VVLGCCRRYHGDVLLSSAVGRRQTEVSQPLARYDARIVVLGGSHLVPTSTRQNSLEFWSGLGLALGLGIKIMVTLGYSRE